MLLLIIISEKSYQREDRMAKRVEYVKPGEKAPATGQYCVVGPRGGKVGREVTVVKGEPMPPTPRKDQAYQLNKGENYRIVKDTVKPSSLGRSRIKDAIYKVSNRTKA